MEWQRERLGELLVRAELIDEATLDSALAIQKREGGKLGEVLVRELILTETQIAHTLASQKDLPFVDLTSVVVDTAAATSIPERMARLRSVIPIGVEDGSLVVAMADPLDIETIDDIELRTGSPVRTVVAPASQIQHAIDKFAVPDAMTEITESFEPEEVEVTPMAVEDVPIVRVVQQILRDAVMDGASDVHMEPTESVLRVRVRIDGVLRDVAELPRAAIPGVISRLKVMSEMDIAERRRPQEGRIAMEVADKKVDLRVVCMPTHWGESIVLRVLNSDIAFRTMSDLGMGRHDFEVLTRMLSRPWGCVLVSGPTGSGKTTTLYASLNRVADETRKVITVEDPIEYLMPSATQVAVNPRIGVTFASGLRTILRADPDIVMVGEVRDPETAEIAVRAALTGHLVLSSIHTNDAASAVTRLSDMGVPPYITSSALMGVVGQRLIRVLCPACKQPDSLPMDYLLRMGYSPEQAAALKPFKAVGCERCRNSGYKGRHGLFEVLEVDDEIAHLALSLAPSGDIQAAAVAKGMRTLHQDGLVKVAQGITSLEEIERVIM